MSTTKRGGGFGGGLGRGLSALIPEDLVIEPELSDGVIVQAALSEISPNPEQPRHRFNEESLRELASSLLEHGVIQPVVVRRGDNGGYILVAGERRFRAAGLAGIETIPVLVMSQLSDAVQLELALVENLQREDLNPVDAARGYARLSERYGHTQEQIAQKVGKERATVANAMRLLKLPEDVLELISDGRLSAGHGKALLGVTSKRQMKEVIAHILNRGLSVRATERMVRGLNATKRPKADEVQRDKVLSYASDMLTRSLATQVKIQGRKKGGGKIVIDFYSDGDLERLMEKLRGSSELG